MICYRDMTFCSFYVGCAEGDTCHRAFTPECRVRADEWWAGYDAGESAPVCFFFKIPDCFKEKK